MSWRAASKRVLASATAELDGVLERLRYAVGEGLVRESEILQALALSRQLDHKHWRNDAGTHIRVAAFGIGLLLLGCDQDLLNLLEWWCPPVPVGKHRAVQ